MQDLPSSADRSTPHLQYRHFCPLPGKTFGVTGNCCRIFCCIKKGHAYPFDTHSLHFLYSFFISKRLKNLQNIIIHNYNHQKHQHHQTCEMNHALNLSVHRFSPDSLDNQKYKPAAIQCRKRKKVHNTKVCR